MKGPYTFNSGDLAGRKYVKVVSGDDRQTIMYARYLMEQHLGRRLTYDETVDHIDEDFTNDDLSNLQVLTRSENSKKFNRLRNQAELLSFICPMCEIEAVKLAGKVRGNRKQGKAGPFCGRSCAGKYSHST